VKPGSISAKDLAELGLSLRQTVELHKVPQNLRASLIEDVIFRFAVLLDERTGSDIHESISGVLSRYARQLGETPAPPDTLLAEVEVTFLKGRKAELNVLRSSIAKPKLLRLVLETALGVRDFTEIKARIDVERRFGELLKKKGHVRAVRFKMASGGGRRRWQEVKLARSSFGRFEQTVDGLLACIRTVVTRSHYQADAGG
jgi:hypothetical protein